MVTAPIATTDAAHGHCCSVNAVARCTGYVCSGGGDAAIRVWKARTLEPVRWMSWRCAHPAAAYGHELQSWVSCLGFTKPVVLSQICYSECSVLRGHRGAVLTMFALDNLLLSGGRDNTVRFVSRHSNTCHFEHMLGGCTLTRPPVEYTSNTVQLGLSSAARQ